MKKIIFFILFPVIVHAQSTFALPKSVESKGYSTALAEYIKALRAKNESVPDTLFIGRHETFPDIELPARIENTEILLLTNAEAEKKYANRRPLLFINMVGDFTKDVCFFKLIVFKTEKTTDKINWWPLYDCNMNFKYNLNTNVFNLNALNFEYPYSNKYTTKH